MVLMGGAAQAGASGGGSLAPLNTCNYHCEGSIRQADGASQPVSKVRSSRLPAIHYVACEWDAPEAERSEPEVQEQLAAAERLEQVVHIPASQTQLHSAPVRPETLRLHLLN